VTEKFALEQTRRHRRAIDLYKWTTFSQALFVDRLSDEFLARAGLTLNEDGRIGSRHQLCSVPDILKCLAGANEFIGCSKRDAVDWICGHDQ